jgi:hypothetical protein
MFDHRSWILTPFEVKLYSEFGLVVKRHILYQLSTICVYVLIGFYYSVSKYFLTLLLRSISYINIWHVQFGLDKILCSLIFIS